MCCCSTPLIGWPAPVDLNAHLRLLRRNGTLAAAQARDRAHADIGHTRLLTRAST